MHIVLACRSFILATYVAVPKEKPGPLSEDTISPTSPTPPARPRENQNGSVVMTRSRPPQEKEVCRGRSQGQQVDGSSGGGLPVSIPATGSPSLPAPDRETILQGRRCRRGRPGFRAGRSRDVHLSRASGNATVPAAQIAWSRSCPAGLSTLEPRASMGCAVSFQCLGCLALRTQKGRQAVSSFFFLSVFFSRRTRQEKKKNLSSRHFHMRKLAHV